DPNQILAYSCCRQKGGCLASSAHRCIRSLTTTCIMSSSNVSSTTRKTSSKNSTVTSSSRPLIRLALSIRSTWADSLPSVSITSGPGCVSPMASPPTSETVLGSHLLCHLATLAIFFLDSWPVRWVCPLIRWYWPLTRITCWTNSSAAVNTSRAQQIIR